MRAFVAAALLLATSLAHADGEVSVRGAYYKERSTRVEQPMIDAEFDTGPKGHLEAHFLVDSITSASAATGTANGQEFTETRYEVGGDYTYDLPRYIKVGGQAKYSTESDYFSTWLAAHGEIGLWEQNTTLHLLLGHSFDEITNGIAVNSGAIGTPARDEHLGTTLVSTSVTQLLTPDLVGNLTYDFSNLDGYQANIYRVVRGGAQPVPERVPDLRRRHAIAASLRAYIRPSRTTLVGAYRFYVDDWGIVAHTPEARVIQNVWRGIDLRARFRYYTQTQANFYQDVYSQDQISNPDVFVTADTKLSAFQTEILGGDLVVSLGTFGVGGTWKDARIELNVERIWQNNAFGDAWVGEAAFTVPFSY
jgi:hypothetical protein